MRKDTSWLTVYCATANLSVGSVEAPAPGNAGALSPGAHKTMGAYVTFASKPRT